LNQTPTFADDISSMVNKARGALGFIERSSKELDDPYIPKTLFITLARPILEYGSPDWCPRIRKSCWSYWICTEELFLPFYSCRFLLIYLSSLANRITMLGTVFFYNIIQSEIKRPKLISQPSFFFKLIKKKRKIKRNFIPLILNHENHESWTF